MLPRDRVLAGGPTQGSSRGAYVHSWAWPASFTAGGSRPSPTAREVSTDSWEPALRWPRRPGAEPLACLLPPLARGPEDACSARAAWSLGFGWRARCVLLPPSGQGAASGLVRMALCPGGVLKPTGKRRSAWIGWLSPQCSLAVWPWAAHWPSSEPQFLHLQSGKSCSVWAPSEDSSPGKASE